MGVMPLAHYDRRALLLWQHYNRVQECEPRIRKELGLGDRPDGDNTTRILLNLDFGEAVGLFLKMSSEQQVDLWVAQEAPAGQEPSAGTPAGPVHNAEQDLAARGIQGEQVGAVPSEEAKNEADWRDVQAKLIRLYGAGEAYTSQRDFAKRLGCSESTINKAINSSDRLKGWMARGGTPLPNAQSLNEVVTDNTVSKSEDNPADHVPDDEVNRVMAILIQEAKTAEQRADLNGLNDEGRREIAKHYLEQEQERFIEDEASGGNRIIGRKP